MNANFETVARDLLAVSGIELVVSIDDLHRPGADLDEVLGEISLMPEDVLEQLVSPSLGLSTGDKELVLREVRDRWASFTLSEKEIIRKHVTSNTRTSAAGQKLGNDSETALKLPTIFTNKLLTLSYRDWMIRRAELVVPNMPPTLLLVDLDFSGEGIPGDAGIGLITDLLHNEPHVSIFCGLLTNAYPLANVHENWRQLCDKHGLDPQRFVLIPKEALFEDVPRFLALIKLVVLGGHAKRLTALLEAAYLTSVNDVLQNLSKMDVYEFEQIVCVSSLREGVWEPDTLLRVFSAYHKRAVRQATHEDDAVYKLADSLRTLSSVPTGDWGSLTPRAVELRRLEWYEEGSELNRQLSPLEIGDLFQVKTRPGKLYILVSQPCDLMVRSDGKRHDSVENATLLEASMGGADIDSDFAFNLPFLEPDVDWRVNLRNTTTVCLELLDLCVLRPDGAAQFTLKHKEPTRLNKAWAARIPRVRKWVEAVLHRHADLMTKGLSQTEADKIATTAWMGRFASGKVNTQAGSLSYNVIRVGRLRQPRAGALLSGLANAMARDAFEHDFVTRKKALPPKESVEGTDSVTQQADSASAADTTSGSV